MPKADQHIVASCGGFGMEPDNLVLDEYILRLARVSNPRVCFVPTASGDNDNFIRRFYQAFTTLECRPRHLSLFKPPCNDLEGFVHEQDVIYVGGGNTRNMLLLWREWSLDSFFRSALRNGTVLSGLSAGAICWFEQATTDSFRPVDSGELDSITCLGFIPGSHCPYYDSESRNTDYNRRILSGELSAGYATEVGTALHFVNQQFAFAVSSRPNVGAFHVAKDGDKLEVQSLPVELLTRNPKNAT